MIPGFSYLAAVVVIAALLLLEKRYSHVHPDSSKTFRYSRSIRAVLFLCIPVWILAGLVVGYTSTPGPDAKIAQYFSATFLVIAVATAGIYVYSRQFFVDIEEDALVWRRLFVVNRIEFSNVKAIAFKRLNNGLLDISIIGHEKVICKIGGPVEGVFEIKALLELRSKKFAIPIELS